MRQVKLLVNRDSKIFLRGYVPQDYIKLFYEADCGSLALPNEFCFVLRSLAIQLRNPISSDDAIKE